MEKSTIIKATSSNESPTPGYLLVELIKRSSSGEASCELMVHTILDRLKQRNVNTKLKALLIVKKLCNEGSPHFKRIAGMQGLTAIVKELTTFVGQMDPLKGDYTNKRIREESKLTLNALFRDDTSQTMSATQSALAGRIKGYGNTAHQTPAVPITQARGLSFQSNRRLSQVGTETVDMISKSLHAMATNMSRGDAAPPAGAGRYPTSFSENHHELAYQHGGMTNESQNKFIGIGNPNFRDPRNQPRQFMDRVRDRLHYLQKDGPGSQGSKQKNASLGGYQGRSIDSYVDKSQEAKLASGSAQRTTARKKGEVGGMWANMTLHTKPAIGIQEKAQRSAQVSGEGLATASAVVAGSRSRHPSMESAASFHTTKNQVTESPASKLSGGKGSTEAIEKRVHEKVDKLVNENRIRLHLKSSQLDGFLSRLKSEELFSLVEYLLSHFLVAGQPVHHIPWKTQFKIATVLEALAKPLLMVTAHNSLNEVLFKVFQHHNETIEAILARLMDVSAQSTTSSEEQHLSGNPANSVNNQKLVAKLDAVWQALYGESFGSSLNCYSSNGQQHQVLQGKEKADIMDHRQSSRRGEKQQLVEVAFGPVDTPSPEVASHTVKLDQSEDTTLSSQLLSDLSLSLSEEPQIDLTAAPAVPSVLFNSSQFTAGKSDGKGEESDPGEEGVSFDDLFSTN